MQRSKLKEILKPLVRKILIENEVLPNSPETPGHREEAPKSKTGTMGTGNDKIKKVAQEAFSVLKDLDIDEYIESKIKEEVIEGVLFHYLGPRAYQAAQILLNSRVFVSYLEKIKNETGENVAYMFDPEFLKGTFDDID